MSEQTKHTENKNIKYTSIFEAGEWLEEKEDLHQYHVTHSVSGENYVYSISPSIRYTDTQYVEKKIFGKIQKKLVFLPRLQLDRDMAKLNWDWIDSGYPKNYPQIISKLGFSQNIASRLNQHRTLWKRPFHLNGLVKFPDITSAKSFEAFCFDYYKNFRNTDYKDFFRSNEVYLLPMEYMGLTEPLQKYMKFQKNLEVEHFYFHY